MTARMSPAGISLNYPTPVTPPKVPVVGSRLSLAGIAQRGTDTDVTINLTGVASTCQVGTISPQTPASAVALSELGLNGIAMRLRTRLSKQANVNVDLVGVEARGQCESLEGAHITVYIDPVVSPTALGNVLGGPVREDPDIIVAAENDTIDVSTDPSRTITLAANEPRTIIVDAETDDLVVDVDTDTFTPEVDDEE